MLIWKIAWRNVLRHKGKTFVVGVILFLGMLIMTLGNAVMEGARQGLFDNIINRFAGEMMIVSDQYTRRDVFFAGHDIKLIPNYLPIKQVLEQQDVIAQALPVARGQVTILNEDGISGSAFFLGVKFDDYQRFSQKNVMAIEGELLTNQTRGLLISDETRKKIFDRQKFWVVPEGTTVNETNLTPKARKLYEAGRLEIRTELVIIGQSQGSLETDIRAPVKGIFRFQELNKWWAQYINFMDLESYRQSFGHLTAGDRSAELSKEQKAMFALDDTDAIFADTMLTTTVAISAEQFKPDTLQQQAEHTTITPDMNLEDGAFSMTLVKLKPGIIVEDACDHLNHVFAEAKLAVNARTWKVTLGEVADIAAIMQGLLFLFVMFIFFVAVIIIMNTLSMAALERSSEIGMMRAVGARKGFISKLFLTETFQIAIVFGGAGIVAGVLLVWIVTAMHISVADREYLGMLLGGDIIRPIINIIGMVLGIVQLLIVTVLATLYPIRVASTITPLEAISRD
jgi:putative ABC transport system permease protein